MELLLPIYNLQNALTKLIIISNNATKYDKYLLLRGYAIVLTKRPMKIICDE